MGAHDDRSGRTEVRNRLHAGAYRTAGVLAESTEGEGEGEAPPVKAGANAHRFCQPNGSLRAVRRPCGMGGAVRQGSTLLLGRPPLAAGMEWRCCEGAGYDSQRSDSVVIEVRFSRSASPASAGLSRPFAHTL